MNIYTLDIYLSTSSRKQLRYNFCEVSSLWSLKKWLFT